MSAKLFQHLVIQLFHLYLFFGFDINLFDFLKLSTSAIFSNALAWLEHIAVRLAGNHMGGGGLGGPCEWGRRR